MIYMSKAERKAAPVLAAHPAPSYMCQSFAAAGLTGAYMDVADELCSAKPDALCEQTNSFTFIELKDGDLNFHRTHESSRAALQDEYQLMTGRFHFENLPHSMTSKALYDAGRTRACLEHGFNHSVYKHLAVQAKLGWQRYVIVFVETPSKRLAMKYLELGLVFCTLDTLPSMLRTIELCQLGFYVPFEFTPKRAKYAFWVTPDHRDKGTSAAVMADKDRAKLLAQIEANDAAEAALCPEGEQPF